MPKLYIFDTEADYIQIKLPKHTRVTCDGLGKLPQEGVFAVVSTDDLASWRGWFRRPDWKFYRVTGLSTDETYLRKVKRLTEKLDNYNIISVEKLLLKLGPPHPAPMVPAIEDFAPEEPTPVSDEYPHALEVEPLPEEPVVERKVPSKILILCQEDLAPKLRGTLFSSTGKSLRTAGRNPLVIRAEELSAVAKSAKPVGCIEVPSYKLADWDAPDILDDFYVVVLSDKEIPLPSCEGDANLFTLQPEDLQDLVPLYSFLSLEME